MDHANGTPSVRVLIANVPFLLGDIVARVLGSEPDFRVQMSRARHGSWGELMRSLEPEVPDVVVIGGTGMIEPLEPLVDALCAHPRLKVLAIQDDGRQASLYEMTPARRELGSASPERIVSEIRRAMREPARIEARGNP